MHDNTYGSIPASISTFFKTFIKVLWKHYSIPKFKLPSCQTWTSGMKVQIRPRTSSITSAVNYRNARLSMISSVGSSFSRLSLVYTSLNLNALHQARSGTEKLPGGFTVLNFQCAMFGYLQLWITILTSVCIQLWLLWRGLLCKSNRACNIPLYTRTSLCNLLNILLEQRHEVWTNLVNFFVSLFFFIYFILPFYFVDKVQF